MDPVQVKSVKARKAHTCWWCETMIAKGEVYHWSSIWIDSAIPDVSRLHLVCLEAITREGGDCGKGPHDKGKTCLEMGTT